MFENHYLCIHKIHKIMYDYLIVGSGLFGAVFAHEAQKHGKKVLVIDKRGHCGGNIFCDNIEGINVHRYGAHIFHTSNRTVWNFVNNFVEFNRYTNSPVANYKGKLYNLPFNMNTFYALWGVTTPEEARQKIEQQRIEAGITNPQNLEEQAISLVGKDIFEILIKHYTEKQWGRRCADLPAFIIKRLPVRFTFDNNYFNDTFQGIPIGGYNVLIDKLLAGIETKTNTDFFENREYFEKNAKKIVFTGKIDEFFEYKFGKLEYRSVRFETETLDIQNFQGNAVVNYTDAETPFTRIIEHKHFEFGTQAKTVISREYSLEYTENSEPFYPINDEKNNALNAVYQSFAEKEEKVIFGGRLAEYKYYDMDKIIENVLNISEKEFGNNP
ncbi:UDP-galactopyranose mutase [Bacteroidia bacterium]|nr:UDP-galactopyranose mutase [Bacteroidia bacterium]GHV43300.1 UDP-galactopyranose mutase [Bacteroidia bacterium]